MPSPVKKMKASSSSSPAVAKKKASNVAPLPKIKSATASSKAAPKSGTKKSKDGTGSRRLIDISKEQKDAAYLNLNDKAIYDMKMNFNIAVKHREIRNAVELGKKILLVEPNNALILEYMPMLKEMLEDAESNSSSDKESSSWAGESPVNNGGTIGGGDINNFVLNYMSTTQETQSGTVTQSTSPQTTSVGEVPASLPDTDASSFYRVD